MTSSRTDVREGALDPALQRMKRRGWVRSEWRQTENNRRARYYSVTATGRRQLKREREEWARRSGGINGVLEWKGGPA